MWQNLWDEYEETVLWVGERLGDIPNDESDIPTWPAIARTVLWQLRGREPFVNGRVDVVGSLQLPEIYSGSPWILKDRRWIAFVNANPAIDVFEIYPTRDDRKIHQENLEKYFDGRFEPNVIREPLFHGRGGAAPARRTATWRLDNGGQPRSSQVTRRHTWAQLDAATELLLRPFLDAERCLAPLGRASAIVDAAPWKFSSWRTAPQDVKHKLAEAGARYLKWFLNEHPPAAIIACGKEARESMRRLSPLAVDNWGVLGTHVERGTCELDKGRKVPWFGVVHPAMGLYFWQGIAAILDQVRSTMENVRS